MKRTRIRLRIFAATLLAAAAPWGQPAVIEPKPGAAGVAPQ